MSVITKDLGAATAYAYAVEKGYTGTEEEFAELMASYATVGQTAVDAKDAAVAAKTAAQTAATTATNKASEATTAAQTATTKAAEAQADADAAALDARQAMFAASTATSKATEATTAAATAVSSKDAAVSANTAAQSAKTAAQTAQQGAETARDAVQSSAAQITTNAEDITQLKEDLKPLYGDTQLDLIENSYWPSSGANAGIPTSYNGWARTNRIVCTPGEVLKITTSVSSAYNVFFNSDTDGDVNSNFNLTAGDNTITVPNDAQYFGLSNTETGMAGTILNKIIRASEVKDAENIAGEALTESENNTKSIDVIERFVGLKSASDEVEITFLVTTSNVTRRTDFFSATGIESISVNNVTGFQHNINYFKTSPSDADAVSENGWQNDTTSFTKPDDYLYCYVRFRKADQSTFTDADVNTLLASLVVTLNHDTISIPKQTVYVSTTGSDTNDGSKSAPFATLQKAVDSGALVVKVGSGNYTGFSAQNRENPLTIMLDSMPVYSTDNPEVPKIKITTGVTGGYGIYANNCTEINLFDVWVDGVTVDCMWLQNIGNVNCTRCFVSNNSADNSMGFRLISVNGVFRDCKAWNIVKDGFNIHRYGNTQFINCIAYDCGDDGISHHDGCTGLISGGEYYRCYKGGISSPYGGSKIDIENVYIHDCTQYGIYSMSTSEMLKSSGRISNCVIKNNGTYDIIATYTDLVGWNNIYDTKSVGAQATFTEY